MTSIDSIATTWPDTKE